MHQPHRRFIALRRIFGRRLASYLSAIPCYLGFLWPLWDQRKQAWHDMIAKTVVVKVR